MALAAANKMALLKIVNGKITCEIGESPVEIRGLNSLSVENGKAKAIHIKALESAPPNPPE